MRTLGRDLETLHPASPILLRTQPRQISNSSSLSRYYASGPSYSLRVGIRRSETQLRGIICRVSSGTAVQMFVLLSLLIISINVKLPVEPDITCHVRLEPYFKYPGPEDPLIQGFSPLPTPCLRQHQFTKTGLTPPNKLQIYQMFWMTWAGVAHDGNRSGGGCWSFRLED